MMGVVVARPNRTSPIFICAKCVRRASGGKTIRKALKTAIRRSDWAARKPPKLVETKCLGICPKKAVAVASGPTLAAGRMLVVRADDVGIAAIRILAGDIDAPKAGVEADEGVAPLAKFPEAAKRRYWDREPSVRTLA